MKKKNYIILLLLVFTLGLVGCGTNAAVNENTENSEAINVVSEETLLEYFTERDLEQTVSEYDNTYELVSNEDLWITEEGVYLITGDVTNTTVIVDVDNESKVQLVLEDVTIVNDDMPAIYVKSADKVFVTITGDNYLEVNGSSTVDDSNLDAGIFSKDDLVINGDGYLEIVSNVNGITSKDDLKITGGTISISAQEDGLEANDSIRIADGTITIDANNDALHAEYEEENLGYIYISGGSLDITAGDDAIRATTYVQIDGGDITINNSYEGIEATQVYINGGTIDLYALDDGLNATSKSDLDVEIVISGGNITIEVGSGDTDGIDSNGDLSISGGVISITAPFSSVDVDGNISQTGGTVYVNGELVEDVSSLSSSGGHIRR